MAGDENFTNTWASLIYTKQLLAMVRGITTGGSSIHYYATWFPVPSTTAIFAASIFRFDKMFSYPHTMQIMVKVRDDLSGRITKRGGVDKNLTHSDKKKLLSGYARAKEILKNAGAKSIFKTWYIAAHPGGTAKIGHIVDANLETKYKNLYVCDCSAIPEAWGLPPTSTIVSLGKYLSKHLLAN